MPTRLLTAALAALALTGPVPAALAQADAGAADARQRLEEARRRLEEAAREIAALSAEAYGPELREVLRLRTGSPRRAMLGVNLGGAEPGTAGVRVTSVSPGGPAAEAGVLPGDVIVAVDGRKVEEARDLTRRMREVEAGQKVALGVRRDGQEREIVVVARAAGLAAWAGADVPGAPALPGMPHFLLREFADAELATVTPGLGRYFGTDRGVLVLRVPQDAGTGLEEGDVILSIGGRTPESGSHALRILRSYQPGEKIELRIMRDRKPRDLAIELPRRPPLSVPRPPEPPPPSR